MNLVTVITIQIFNPIKIRSESTMKMFVVYLPFCASKLQSDENLNYRSNLKQAHNKKCIEFPIKYLHLFLFKINIQVWC